jgi:DNA-binding transcriptional ArsR family regulator
VLSTPLLPIWFPVEASLLRRSSRLIVPAVDRRDHIRILNEVLNHQASLDLMLAALADPSRRSMVERLGRGPASVSELAVPLSMSLPAVMRHLRVLESSGLVRSEKAGRVRTCRINPSALRTAEDWLAGRRAELAAGLDRLGAYLAKEAHTDEETS